LIKALADFDGIWEALTGEERVRLVHLLVEKVVYDAATQQVTIAFHLQGLMNFINS